ncbi:unnamed protein product [marine sediment metagenome]|uniref:Uncharacterized protein n=1 Tax=marine sediment metagenome TaxID=412755 RepID=X1VMI2_9ZZZZ
MSAKIRGVNALPEWTYWTLEMAPPAVFTETVPINKAITYDGSILGGGIAPGGDAISEIRVFVDISALPVASFPMPGILEDGKNYVFDFETGTLGEGVVPAGCALPIAAFLLSLVAIAVAIAMV